ncbi:Crp/Fnr family transcriptional regulator [Paraflavitalea soli]|uniref:Crp/Fnr family transcriptional regulator n=1 Tax=Paraflavitalea soli TaxID=2315862 RepID=A0A3B7MFU4_9BACT|nr:Crp/Fnr family transcriptional regulator [Paraflavitalea soli]AXY73204.1 Crp/Fnr family transcriptional regulator [Paraflavitalea soli]
MTHHYQQMLQAIRQISPMPDPDWQLCQANLEYRHISKGAYFVEEGNVYPYIGFVLQGLLRAYYLVDGEEINCQFYFEGHWPKAYHNFLTQTPSKMWIRAIEDTEVLLIRYDHLQALFQQSRHWERFGRIATENAFVAAQLRNEMLLLDDPETRYLKLTHIHPQILERVSLTQLASYIGIRQPSLSRIRRRLMSRIPKRGRP